MSASQEGQEPAPTFLEGGPAISAKDEALMAKMKEHFGHANMGDRNGSTNLSTQSFEERFPGVFIRKKKRRDMDRTFSAASLDSWVSEVEADENMAWLMNSTSPPGSPLGHQLPPALQPIPNPATSAITGNTSAPEGPKGPTQVHGPMATTAQMPGMPIMSMDALDGANDPVVPMSDWNRNVQPVQCPTKAPNRSDLGGGGTGNALKPAGAPLFDDAQVPSASAPTRNAAPSGQQQTKGNNALSGPSAPSKKDQGRPHGGKGGQAQHNTAPLNGKGGGSGGYGNHRVDQAPSGPSAPGVMNMDPYATPQGPAAPFPPMPGMPAGAPMLGFQGMNYAPQTEFPPRYPDMPPGGIPMPGFPPMGPTPWSPDGDAPPPAPETQQQLQNCFQQFMCLQQQGMAPPGMPPPAMPMQHPPQEPHAVQGQQQGQQTKRNQNKRPPFANQSTNPQSKGKGSNNCKQDPPQTPVNLQWPQINQSDQAAAFFAQAQAQTQMVGLGGDAVAAAASMAAAAMAVPGMMKNSESFSFTDFFLACMCSQKQNTSNMAAAQHMAAQLVQSQQAMARKAVQPAAPAPAQGQGQGQEGEDKQAVDPRKFKTRMCRNYETKGHCPYEHTCCFAHGPDELRNLTQNHKMLSSIGYFSNVILLSMTNGQKPALPPHCLYQQPQMLAAAQSPEDLKKASETLPDGIRFPFQDPMPAALWGLKKEAKAKQLANQPPKPPVGNREGEEVPKKRCRRRRRGKKGTGGDGAGDAGSENDEDMAA